MPKSVVLHDYQKPHHPMCTDTVLQFHVWIEKLRLLKYELYSLVGVLLMYAFLSATLTFPVWFFKDEH